MALKQYNPTSPGRRFMTTLDFSDLSKKGPERALTEPLKKSGGRNSKGRITIWFRGGGHKRAYRVIDFRRDKRNIPAKVATLEYDPNRSARIALLHYVGRREALHPRSRGAEGGRRRWCRARPRTSSPATPFRSR